MAINGGRKMLLQTINKFHLDQPCMLLFHEALSKVVIEFVLYGRILVCLFVFFFSMSSLTAVDETGKEKNSY